MTSFTRFFWVFTQKSRHSSGRGVHSPSYPYSLIMALPAKETTTKTVVGIRFGFYTDEEVSCEETGNSGKGND